MARLAQLDTDKVAQFLAFALARLPAASVAVA